MDLDLQTDKALETMAQSSTSSDSRGVMLTVPESPTISAPPQTFTIKGYPKDIAQNAVEEKFLCAHCDLILRSPKQSDCGHRFCTSCSVELARQPQPVKCKLCVKEGATDEESVLHFDGMFEDKAAIREMRRMPVKCPNPGCSWKGTFLDYANTHENACDKKMVNCSLCGVQVSQAKVNHHESHSCPKRPVSCPHCKENMIFEQQEKHQTACPQAPMKCDKCSKQVARAEITKHQVEECIHRTIECPVPDCNVKVTLEQFPFHISKTPQSTQKHLVYLFTKTEELTKQLQDIQAGSAPNVGGAAASGAGDVAGAEGGADVTVFNTEDKQKLKLHEDLMAVLHGEILRCINQVEALGRDLKRQLDFSRELRDKMQALERNMGLLEVRMNERMVRDPQEAGIIVESGNGMTTWKLDAFSQIRRAAINKQQSFVCSPPFFTSPMGYKLRLRLFANGDGAATNKAMSVFIQLMKGSCDDLLVWPFSGKIHFMLVDCKNFTRHKKVSFNATNQSAACSKPQSEVNPAMGCLELITLQEMSENLEGFVIQDVMYMRVAVEVSPAAVERVNKLDPRVVGQRM